MDIFGLVTVKSDAKAGDNNDKDFNKDHKADPSTHCYCLLCDVCCSIG